MNTNIRTLLQKTALSIVSQMFEWLEGRHESEHQHFIELFDNAIWTFINEGTTKTTELIDWEEDDKVAEQIEKWLTDIESCCVSRVEYCDEVTVKCQRELLGEAFDERDRLKERVEQLARHVGSLTDCVTDGIEKNYPNLKVWRSTAKQILKNIKDEESNH